MCNFFVLGVPEANWARVCIVIDKLDKYPAASISEELLGLGLTNHVVDGVLNLLQVELLIMLKFCFITFNSFRKLLNFDRPKILILLSRFLKRMESGLARV